MHYFVVSKEKRNLSLLVMEDNPVLALACMLRFSEIAAIERTSIIFSEKAVKFALAKHRKWQHAEISGDSRYGKDVDYIFRKSSKNLLWPSISMGKLTKGNYRIKTNAQWNALENISAVRKD